MDVAAQRIYHLTHVDNLPGILEAGALLADATPAVDISAAHTRELRRGTDIGAGESVARFVPFFLTPNSTVWEGMRSGDEDDRLAPEALEAEAYDFVMLVSTIGTAAEGETVVADGDAAGSLTRFAATKDASERMLRRLHDDEDSIIAAEFLVRETFPFESVTLIGVANDRARATVKTILQSSAYRPKVAVYPPWFQKPEA